MHTLEHLLICLQNKRSYLSVRHLLRQKELPVSASSTSVHALEDIYVNVWMYVCVCTFLDALRTILYRLEFFEHSMQLQAYILVHTHKHYDVDQESNGTLKSRHYLVNRIG